MPSRQAIPKNNISFVEKDVGRDHMAVRELINKSGQMGVPVIDANGQIVIGFNELVLNKILLDA